MRVRLAAILIAGLFLVGAIAFHQVYHAPWGLSFYLVLAVMSTVSDARIHPTTSGQLLVTGVVIVFGTALWIFGLSLLVSRFLEADLGYFKERRLIMEIQKWEGHFVVVGAGRVGESIARELIDMGEKVVVVDTDPARIERIQESGCSALLIHGFSAEMIRAAHLETAKGLALALPDDPQNLYAFLTARTLNPHLSVVARAQTAESLHYLQNLGIDRVLLPDVVGGRRLARMLVKPVAHDLLMALLNEEGVQVNEVSVDAHSPIAHQPVRRVREIYGDDVTLIGYWRDQGLHMAPKAADVILPEDTLILVQALDN